MDGRMGDKCSEGRKEGTGIAVTLAAFAPTSKKRLKVAPGWVGFHGWKMIQRPQSEFGEWRPRSGGSPLRLIILSSGKGKSGGNRRSRPTREPGMNSRKRQSGNKLRLSKARELRRSKIRIRALKIP